ncbi:hypothetical protein SAMN05444008_107236 [Cnuella takakiae]|uniref:Uncharacterized protein n=1 Tax=Cnuella takakiae TaxID=1302690 RepID=A0A1M5BBE6_9BACT|nr:hypothetical protein [Cnuella takakiae]OLY93416.1 hypothetical protein BUE76_17140 [Cnuella takakiae]SHF39745.1 hypothetical protein SAMN05444008_107236 [Cnuella takakiae]
MAEIITSVEKEKELSAVPSGRRNYPGVGMVWNARRLSLYLLATSFVLLGLHLLAYFIFFRFPQLSTASLLTQRFGLDRDGNIPTLFATLLLLFSAVLLYFIAQQTRQQQGKTYGQWLLLSLIFVFLGIDEATQIHEFTSSLIKSVNHGPIPGLFRHAWIIPYLVLTVAVGLYYFRFVLALPRRTRNLFILAGAIYVGSAMGLEMLEGLEATINGKSSLLILKMQTVEEMLEMNAIILFNYALMQYLGDTHLGIRVEATKRRAFNKVTS